MPIRKFLAFIKGNSKNKTKLPKTASVLVRNAHCISRKNISPNALKVLYRLKEKGFQAFLVGGCVRDLLLGREPKDFDIATNANPQQIKKIFRNARMIGRRFCIVHILFRKEIIEVSTFRSYQTDETEVYKSDEGMLLRDNVYGSIEDDAKRRDFTVNALFYNIADFSVVDFHQGLKNLNHGVLKVIGNPDVRYREDPVRMLRAVRFAAKLGFRIETETEKPIHELRFLLQNIAPARLFTEILKLFLGGQALETFKLLRHYALFEFLFPAAEHMLKKENFARINALISLALEDTDARIAENKTVSPGYLTATLLWHAFDHEFQALKRNIKDSSAAFTMAYTNIVSQQQQAAAIPKHFFLTARAIWEMQYRMEKRRPHRCFAIINHPRFRAAFDFLKLRVRVGETLESNLDWWTTFYKADESTRDQLLTELNHPKSSNSDHAS